MAKNAKTSAATDVVADLKGISTTVAALNKRHNAVLATLAKAAAGKTKPEAALAAIAKTMGVTLTATAAPKAPKLAKADKKVVKKAEKKAAKAEKKIAKAAKPSKEEKKAAKKAKKAGALNGSGKTAPSSAS